MQRGLPRAGSRARPRLEPPRPRENKLCAPSASFLNYDPWCGAQPSEHMEGRLFSPQQVVSGLPKVAQLLFLHTPWFTKSGEARKGPRTHDFFASDDGGAGL